jgi:predicted glutamine amidotransferase
LCGIFGFIGRSKNPKVTYELLHNLFLKTEIRGTDATGFYATHPGDASIIFDKEPVKSSEYVKKDVWTKLFAQNNDVDLFIGHCRQTSVGGGPERVNKNNHPHWSHDRRVAITHNGKIPEFTALKSRYDIESECDSEILLRMFESAQIIAKDKEEELKKEFPTLTPFLAERLTGLKEIFSRVNYGAMAVAIAERGDDNQRFLWLFRDDDRPLHVVDMRETLGQIFYCSTAEIWRNALDATPILKKENNKEGVDYIPSDQVIIEFPSYQIWLLNLDPSKEAVANEEGILQDNSWNIRKYKVTKTKYIDWKESEDDDDKLSFKMSKEQKRTPVANIITRLGDNDVIKSEEKEKIMLPLGVSADDVDKKKLREETLMDLGLGEG